MKSNGDFTFRYCSNLAEISIEEGSEIELIEKKAFIGCFLLKEIKMPASVK